MTGIDVLTAGGPGLATMKPLTAVCFLLLVLGRLQLMGVGPPMSCFEFGTALLAVASVVVLFRPMCGYARWLDRAERDRIEPESQLLR